MRSDFYRWIGLALAGLLLGCGSDGGNGPAARNVAGTWMVTFSNMQVVSISTCTLDPVTLTLTHTGKHTVSGTHSATNLTCGSDPAVVQTVGTITSSDVEENTILLQFAHPARTRTFNGTFASDTEMSGTVQWTTEDGILFVTGDWSAIKQ